MDFMTGSERVGGWLLAFVRNGTNDVCGVLELNDSGVLSFK